MEFKVNKEQLKVLGKATLKVGKSIIIEGTKAVAVKSMTNVIMEGFDNGVDGVKKLSLDNVLGTKKKGEVDSEEPVKEKKSLFKRKKKGEIVPEEVEMTIIRDSEGEIVGMAPTELVNEHMSKQDETKED